MRRDAEDVVNLIVRFIAAFVLLAVSMSCAAAGTPEEEFRAGLSAFNGGDFAAALRLWRPLAEMNDARLNQCPAAARLAPVNIAVSS